MPRRRISAARQRCSAIRLPRYRAGASQSCPPPTSSGSLLAVPSGLLVLLVGEKAAVSLVDQRGECLMRCAGGGGLKFEVLLGNRGRPGHRGVRHDPPHRELVGASIGGVGRASIAHPTHIE